MRRLLILSGFLCLVSCVLAPASAWADDEQQSSNVTKVYGFLLPAEKKDAKDESKTAENKTQEANSQEVKSKETKPQEPNATETAKSEDKQPADKTADKTADKAADKSSDKTASKASDKTASKSAAKKPKVVRFTLNGSYPEGPGSLSLLGESQTSLQAMVDRMDQAAADKEVAAVWLRIENLDIGPGKLYELRAPIARIRKSGKPIWAELTSAESMQYRLAGACDEIVMAPSGTLIVPGVRAEVTFYKGLLDKLGLQFDALQMGKYKGAAEPMTRTSMSPELKESMTAIVDDNYEDLVATLAADRKLKDYQVKSLLDVGMFTAETAAKAKLVDRVLYADQLRDALSKRLKADDIELVTDYKKKKVDVDLSGIGGALKFMQLVMGGKQPEKVSKEKKIAVIFAVGEIIEGKSSTSILGGASLGSTTIVEALRKAADDPTVAAVVMRIDSPGGSAVGSDLIWRETVRLKKPLVASMGDVAGSGGYYIAMGAKKIYAAPGTMTGSIGVVGGKLVLKGLYDKVGLNTEVIARGALSGALSDLQPFTTDERAAWTGLLQETYSQFVGKAAEGRKMTFQELEKLAQGRVYSGHAAKGLKLVDEMGTLKDAIIDAKKLAGLKPDEPVELLMLPRSQGLLEQLLGGDSVAGEVDSIMPEAGKILLQAKLWKRMLSEKTLLWMPYSVKIK
jgi:protease IV